MSKNKPEIQTSVRPEFHYSLPSYHIHTPTGLIFIKGIYHLFLFKKNTELYDSPNVWTHIQSKDLIHWTEQKAITHDEKKGVLHSGYIIQDSKNTSGLGSSAKDPLIAVFNHKESEHLMYLQSSKDLGASWTLYGKGPILDIKKSKCRDPYIFWHEGSSRWIMLITIPHEYKVQIYSSKNLIRWDLISDFGSHPSFNKKWAHATMLPCRGKQNNDIIKWVLMVGITEGEIANRYFVGEFDGKSFKCDHALDAILKIDHGRDFCAPTLCNVPTDRRAILIGDQSNPAYQQHMPTIGWRGMLTLPREIVVSREADGSYRLVQTLTKEWPSMRSKAFEFTKSAMTNEVEWEIPLSDKMEFDLTIDSHKGCTIEFDFGSKTKLLITWDVLHHQLSLDRTSKNLGFHPAYSSYDQANLSTAHTLSIHMILDKYSLDIFADGGKVCLTSLFFSPHSLQRFRLIGKQFAASGLVWHLGTE